MTTPRERAYAERREQGLPAQVEDDAAYRVVARAFARMGVRTDGATPASSDTGRVAA